MRILHIIDSGGVYGAERVLLYLAREQKRQGHEPLLGSIARPGAATTPLEALAGSWGLSVLPIRLPPKATPAVVRSLLRTVRQASADVVHSHGYKADVMLGPMPRAWRGPMIATLHGWLWSPAFTALWLRERLDLLSLGRMDLVVAVTHAMLSVPALRRMDPAKRRVIANGIPPLAQRMADLTADRAPPLPEGCVTFMKQRPTLVAIGRLSPEKGFDLLLQAFAQVRESGALHCQLLIAGEGPARATLEQAIGFLGLRDCVLLAGYVAGADRLLAHAAGFVMSSFTEGMPLVLLEALQWNVPILATAVGAIPEILRQGGGQLVAPHDLTALSQGLASVLSSGTVGAPLGGAVERFGSARMAEEYQQAYLDALSRRN
jgi:glycosyltransferase involved in cell wall biosynthesis